MQNPLTQLGLQFKRNIYARDYQINQPEAKILRSDPLQIAFIIMAPTGIQ